MNDLYINEFIKIISNNISKYSFVKIPRPDEQIGDALWVSSNNGWSNWFSFTYSTIGPNICKIEPWMGVRVEQVENIFHISSGFPPKSQHWTCTIASYPGELLRKRGKTGILMLSSEGDVPIIAAEAMRLFREMALPYYELYKTLEAIDKDLNSQPNERLCRIRPGGAWIRCSIGIIIARLVKRHNYEELINIYTEKVENTARGFYLPRFKLLLLALDQLSLL